VRHRRYSELLADRCDSVLSVDVSQRMIDIACEGHARPNISYQVRGLFDVTTERDSTFDAILAMFVLHMFPSHEAALRHLKTLLAPGGHLIFMDKVARPDGLSRRYLYYVAVRDSLYLAVRRRVLRPALRELRTRAHSSWIAHQFAYPGLPRTVLHAMYADLLPGATIVDHRHACAVHWQAPSDKTGTGTTTT